MERGGRNEVSEEDVRKLLGDGQNVFGQHMKPFKRKELLRVVMTRCEISDKCVKIGVNPESARQFLTRSSEQDATLQPSRGAN